jgi:hypothetical protein
MAANGLNPDSLWSLWVPAALLALIGLAAIYFANIKLR